MLAIIFVVMKYLSVELVQDGLQTNALRTMLEEIWISFGGGAALVAVGDFGKDANANVGQPKTPSG